MRSARAAHCPPLTRPHNQRYVQVPAAACDALRTRQGAADAALVDPLPRGGHAPTVRLGPTSDHQVRHTNRLDRAVFLSRNSHQGYHDLASTQHPAMDAAKSSKSSGISTRCTTNASGPNTLQLLQRL
jgi:hypothetical protein